MSQSQKEIQARYDDANKERGIIKTGIRVRAEDLGWFKERALESRSCTLDKEAHKGGKRGK